MLKPSSFVAKFDRANRDLRISHFRRVFFLHSFYCRFRRRETFPKAIIIINGCRFAKYSALVSHKKINIVTGHIVLMRSLHHLGNFHRCIRIMDHSCGHANQTLEHFIFEFANRFLLMNRLQFRANVVNLRFFISVC